MRNFNENQYESQVGVMLSLTSILYNTSLSIKTTLYKTGGKIRKTDRAGIAPKPGTIS